MTHNQHNTEPKVKPNPKDVAFGIQMQEIFERLKHLETCVNSRYLHGYRDVKKLHRMQRDILEFRVDFARTVPGPDGRLDFREPAPRSAYYPTPGGKRDAYGDLVEPRDSDET